jgi:hypothetical protein
VPLANRKRRLNDPAASVTTVRRVNYSRLPLPAAGVGAPVGGSDLADKSSEVISIVSVR